MKIICHANVAYPILQRGNVAYLNSLRNFYLGEIVAFYHFRGEKSDLIFTQ